MSAKVPVIRGPMGAFGNVGGVALADEDDDVNDKPQRVDYNQLQQQQPRRKPPAKQQQQQPVGPPSDLLQLVGGLDGDYGDQPSGGGGDYEEQQQFTTPPPPKRRAVQQQQQQPPPPPRQRARVPTPEPLDDQQQQQRQYDDNDYTTAPEQQTVEDLQPSVAQLTPTQYFDVHVKTAKAQMIELAEALATTQEVMRGLKNTLALLEKTPMGGRAVKPRPTSNGTNGRTRAQTQEHDF